MSTSGVEAIEAPATAARGNFDLARWHPSDVDAHAAGASHFGLLDALGNGWEWTASVFAGFDGFEALPEGIARLGATPFALEPLGPGRRRSQREDPRLLLLGQIHGTP